jgi:hypothetical protein
VISLVDTRATVGLSAEAFALDQPDERDSQPRLGWNARHADLLYEMARA